MPYNGSGVFQLVTGNPVVTGTTISSTVHNNTMADIANNGLTLAVTKDGQQTPTANLPMGGFRHTNVGNAVARTDYAAAGQVQDGVMQWLTSVNGTDTITASLAVPPLAAYVAGQTFRFLSAGANATNSVTLNINSLGAKPITRSGGGTLQVGDITGSAIVGVVYDGTNFQMVGQTGRLLNVQVITTSGTYTPTPGTNSVIVEIQGAGGAGGGAPLITAGQGSAGGCGGAGGYVRHRMLSGFAGASVVIGAGGVGAAGAFGGNGGNSSFAGIVAGGGSGGGISSASTSLTTAGGGSGGTAAVGSILRIPGGNGPLVTGNASSIIFVHQAAPAGYLGAIASPANVVTNGNPGLGYGSGGGGTFNLSGFGGGTALVGGAGAPGVVIVWEYS